MRVPLQWGPGSRRHTVPSPVILSPRRLVCFSQCLSHTHAAAILKDVHFRLYRVSCHLLASSSKPPVCQPCWIRRNCSAVSLCLTPSLPVIVFSSPPCLPLWSFISPFLTNATFPSLLAPVVAVIYKSGCDRQQSVFTPVTKVMHFASIECFLLLLLHAVFLRECIFLCCNIYSPVLSLIIYANYSPEKTQVSLLLVISSHHYVNKELFDCVCVSACARARH